MSSSTLLAFASILLGAGTAAALAGGAAAPQSSPLPGDWLAAERAVVRLEPSTFPGLPPAIVRVLEAHGCRVPQTTFASRPENVASGHFFDDPRPLDWAALCSRNGRSTLLVIPGDAGAELLSPGGRNVAVLNDRPDADFLQVVAAGRIGFSRSISTANASDIARHAQRAGISPPPLMHDGIEDAFAGKASIIWYRYAGHWLPLPGSD